MKKILLLIASITLAALAANAQQWSFGPKVGVSFATANGFDGAKVREGLIAGVFADRMVNNYWGLQAELLFTQQGWNVETEGSPKVRTRLDYISMPILGKYYIVDGLNFQMGGQFSYLVGAKEKESGSSNRSVRSAYNKYNIEFLAGLAYDFDFGLVVEGRYNLGLTRTMSLNNGVTSGYLHVAVGWKF